MQYFLHVIRLSSNVTEHQLCPRACHAVAKSRQEAAESRSREVIGVVTGSVFPQPLYTPISLRSTRECACRKTEIQDERERAMPACGKKRTTPFLPVSSSHLVFIHTRQLWMALHCKSASDEKKATESSCTSAKRKHCRIAVVARATEETAGCTQRQQALSRFAYILLYLFVTIGIFNLIMAASRLQC